MKCEKCNRLATVHLTEIRGGKKIEKHLCEECAASVAPRSPSAIPVGFVLRALGTFEDWTGMFFAILLSVGGAGMIVTLGQLYWDQPPRLNRALWIIAGFA
jgi:hypothetical protein